MRLGGVGGWGGASRADDKVERTDGTPPPSPRFFRIASTAAGPRFFTAPKPKRIASPTGVKFQSLELTSGGKTVICMSRHSLMYFAISAGLPVSEVSSAAMKSTG